MKQIIQKVKMTRTLSGKAQLVRWVGRVVAFGAGCLWCLSAAAGGVVPAQSADPSAPLVSEVISPTSQLKLLVNKSTVLETKVPYKRVNVAQQDIADVNLLGQGKLLVTGKKAGSTQLIVWDDGEKSQIIDLAVVVDVQGLSDEIKKLFPGVKVEVAASNADVVLKGNVPSIEVASQITQLAKPYGAATLNFLEVSGGQQVMLSVRIAEVSRSATTALGINGAFGADRYSVGSNLSGINPTSLVFGKTTNSDVSPVASAVTLYGSGKLGSVLLEGFLEALRQNSLLRILAEPNLIAVSGQEASFLAGGAIPIPVSQGGQGNGAAISVDYREYGVKLKFVPVVLGDGRIRLKVSPEISDLDYANAVESGGFKIPGVTERKVTTTVELSDGQTFAIAGLLNSSVAASKDVVPVLGDIPVIGPMFRTMHYSRKETEMVVLVTPHLVEPMNPADVQRLPGEQWRFPNENDLFFNGDLGGEKEAPRTASGMASGKKKQAPTFHGQYGFVAVQPPKPAAPPMANTGKD